MPEHTKRGQQRKTDTAAAELPPDVAAERSLDIPGAAAMLDVAPNTLETWRRLGKGPPFFRIGKRIVRYRLKDLIAYRDARMCGSVKP